MSKIAKKIAYAISDLREDLAQTAYESLIYWLYVSYKRFSPWALSRDIVGEYYRAQILYQRLQRLYKRGYIKRLGKKRQFSFEFDKDKRYAFLGSYVGEKYDKFKKGWDKKWRLVIYDVPDKKKGRRNQLRTFLYDRGFGKVQESCMVSCYDFSSPIAAFAGEIDVLNCICLYEGAFYAGKDIDQLVRQAWNINSLHLRYESLIADCRNDLRDLETKDVSAVEYYQRYCRMFEEFKAIISYDPFLPTEFCRTDKLRDEAEKALADIFRQFSRIKITL